MKKKMSIFNSLKAYVYGGILKTKNKKQQVEKKNTTSWKIEEKEETMAQMRKGQYLSVGLHVETAPDLHKSKTHLVKMLFGGKGKDP